MFTGPILIFAVALSSSSLASNLNSDSCAPDTAPGTLSELVAQIKTMRVIEKFENCTDQEKGQIQSQIQPMLAEAQRCLSGLGEAGLKIYQPVESLYQSDQEELKITCDRTQDELNKKYRTSTQYGEYESSDGGRLKLSMQSIGAAAQPDKVLRSVLFHETLHRFLGAHNTSRLQIDKVYGCQLCCFESQASACQICRGDFDKSLDSDPFPYIEAVFKLNGTYAENLQNYVLQAFNFKSASEVSTLIQKKSTALNYFVFRWMEKNKRAMALGSKNNRLDAQIYSDWRVQLEKDDSISKTLMNDIAGIAVLRAALRESGDNGASEGLGSNVELSTSFLREQIKIHEDQLKDDSIGPNPTTEHFLAEYKRDLAFSNKLRQPSVLKIIKSAAKGDEGPAQQSIAIGLLNELKIYDAEVEAKLIMTGKQRNLDHPHSHSDLGIMQYVAMNPKRSAAATTYLDQRLIEMNNSVSDNRKNGSEGYASLEKASLLKVVRMTEKPSQKVLASLFTEESLKDFPLETSNMIARMKDRSTLTKDMIKNYIQTYSSMPPEEAHHLFMYDISGTLFWLAKERPDLAETIQDGIRSQLPHLIKSKKFLDRNGQNNHYLKMIDNLARPKPVQTDSLPKSPSAPKSVKLPKI